MPSTHWTWQENRWVYVRGGLVAVSFVGGIFGEGRVVSLGYPWPQLAVALFAFGVIGMLLLLGIQAFNPRSASRWAFPQWGLNPFTTRQPLQLFHFCGYFFLAAGIGALLRALVLGTAAGDEPIALASWGAGIIAGVWCCSRVFPRKMERLDPQP
jgi:hypothetical protein